MELLLNTAGSDVVATAMQRLDRPHPRTFVGSGKVEEVAALAESSGANLVVFDDELSPSQQVNLERLLPEVRVLDRTAVILEIFALHAVSREGKLQVELARLEYLLPRLRGLWGHLERERLGGGRGARFGAGESQLETDRRMARRRISELRRELVRVGHERHLQRKKRSDSGVFRVALVGYTNAGKSSLLNALTGADVLAYDMLFATLDSTTRRLTLADGREVTLTDTVGFINKLPHGLVEAFKSTLEEVNEADLLLHVVDSTSSQRDAQIQAVKEVLQEIGAHDRHSITVLNKVDALEKDEREVLERRFPNAALVSAHTSEGLADLLSRIATEANRGTVVMNVVIPFAEGGLVAVAHERCQIIHERHSEAGTALTILVPEELVARFKPFLVPEAS